MRTVVMVVFFLSFAFVTAQDTVYVRHSLKFLTSKKCFGRGYVKNGLHRAEKYIVSEIVKSNATPLFNNSYTQAFVHAANTFPKKCSVKLNKKKLVPGLDFIVDPSSCSASGKFVLTKTDSITFTAAQVLVTFKNKLTFGVALTQSGVCKIELDKNRVKETPAEIEVRIDNRHLKKFESRNIGCTIKGTSLSDSLIVFTAHYDHLGGMGKHTFFAGANDNASGTGMLLDLIKHYSNHNPKYTTVFIFFAGEEAGLLGSRHFTQNSAVNLKKIKFLVNLDLLGTGDDGIMVVNGAIHEKQFALLSNINDKKQLVKQIKKRGKAANSDHYWFSEAGVPCFFIYTLGGVSFYHDVLDLEKTLPLTDYVDIFKLLTLFADSL